MEMYNSFSGSITLVNFLWMVNLSLTKMVIFNQKNFLILNKIGLFHTLVLPFFYIYKCGITLVEEQKNKKY